MTHFNGPDYVPPRDDARLTRQQERIFGVMRDGAWRSLQEITEITGDPPASVSAQLRHLRKPRFGSHVVDKKYQGEGLFLYRLGARASGPGLLL